ncbi:MAG: class I SAM-dependent methyltransferase [Actinobacteria bacterium]|nr:class I SAM-dependent methyltransferase [Actinomycetota bacterium]MBE3114638.1 class I SAM-dependent methyltransferase [Actinomycetota bacterium]
MDKIYGKDTYEKPFDRFLKRNYKEPLVGVEIGVETGFHAKNLLDTISNISKLYLIDPYEEYQDDRILRSYASVKPSYLKFKENLKSFPKEKVVFIKKKSLESLDEIPNKIDFVYIDGNHSYDVVKAEIDAYYKKLKIGGLLGGDEWQYSRFPGVTRAINEFIDENNLKFHTEPYKVFTGKTSSGFIIDNDWWVIKNEINKK